METIEKRSRIFRIIDSLENDLVDYLNSKATKEILEKSFSEDEKKKISERQDEKTLSESPLYRLDLSDKYFFMLRLSKSPSIEIDTKISKSIERNILAINEIRRRSHHASPLRQDDYRHSIHNAKAIVAIFPDFKGLQNILSQINTYHGWNKGLDGPFDTSLSVLESRTVLHNLPSGDHDETGLIGRSDDVENLLNLIKNDRFPVITVVAPGGFGKTALTLEVLHRLVLDETCPYEYVAFVSLQTEKLSDSGIESIVGAVQTLDEAIPQLSEKLEEIPDGKNDELRTLLEGIKTLVVIDNLETVDGSDVLRFIESLPKDVDFLFTSRVGIGELERRYDLQGLRKQEAVNLFKARLDYLGIKEVLGKKEEEFELLIERVGNTPLGVIYAANLTKEGYTVSEVIQQQLPDFYQFCCEKLYNDLTDLGRKIVWTLFELNSPTSLWSLAGYLKEDVGSNRQGTDKVREVVQQLKQKAFVSIDVSSNTSIIELSPILANHLRSIPRSDELATYLKSVNEIDVSNKKSVIDHDKARDSDWLVPFIVRGGTEADNQRARLAEALRLSKGMGSGLSEAINIAFQVCDSAPTFWEAHRVLAFLYIADQKADQSIVSYRKALELAPDDKERGIVRGYLAHVLSSHPPEGDYSIGVEEARKAYEEFPVHNLKFTLMNCLIRASEYEEAIDLGVELLNTERGKFNIKVLTSLLEVIRRCMEVNSVYPSSEEVDKSLKYGDLAFELLSELLNSQNIRGRIDRRLADKGLNIVNEELRTFRHMNGVPKNISDRLVRLTEAYEELLHYTEATQRQKKDFNLGVDYLINVDENLSKILSAYLVSEELSSDDSYIGKITNVLAHKGYGFVSSKEFPDGVFLHASKLKIPIEELKPGQLIEFTVTEDEKGLSVSKVKVLS